MAQAPITPVDSQIVALLKKYNVKSMAEIIMDGLKKRCSSLWGIQKPELVLTNDPKWFFSVRNQGQNQNMQYPMTYVMPTDLARNDATYSPAKLQKSPMSKIYGVLEGKYVEMKILPTAYNITFNYITNDPLELFRFANDWIHHSVSGELDFSVDFLGSSYDIQAKTSENFAIPQREMAPDTTQEIIGEGTIIITGYTNRIRWVPPELLDNLQNGTIKINFSAQADAYPTFYQGINGASTGVPALTLPPTKPNIIVS